VQDRALLEVRGALIIRKLCALLDGSSIYLSFASILAEKTDYNFADTMVQTLNLILLTAPELAALRQTLKNCFQRDGTDSERETFFALFACWSHNPVATFSLCLLSQAYDLSARLIFRFAEVDVTVGFLMQIDKLVQLLESPIFIPLRLHLLDVNTKHYVHLLKSLYGLLMLLPQSQAYKMLSERLTTISSLQLHMGGVAHASPSEATKGSAKGAESSDTGLHEKLLKEFEEVQARHSSFRQQLSQRRSLLASATAPPAEDSSKK
jgi:vacuole morphology and inheritance protein 14